LNNGYESKEREFFSESGECGGEAIFPMQYPRERTGGNNTLNYMYG
jgi:hypothetical protein